MQTIRWAVIGLGRFGAIHARTLQSLTDVELVAVSRRDAKKLHAAAAELGVAAAHTDYRAILDDPQVDAVTIASHWREHFAIAQAALLAGKHVLLEKPMAANADECRQLLDIAANAPGHFLIGHVCRFDPRITLAKQAIDEGRIGRIVSMHARRNLPRAPGHVRLDKISPLLGDGIHDADLMMWFSGQQPVRVYGCNVRVDQFEHPDIGWAMLHFEQEQGEAIGVVETVWRLPENTPTAIDAKMEVIGEKGRLSIDCANTGLTILDADGLRMPDTAYWPRQHGAPVGALRSELEYFANCIRNDRRPTVITPSEAARAVAVMETAEQSAAEQRPLAVEWSENA